MMAEIERAEEQKPGKPTRIWLNGKYVGARDEFSAKRFAIFLKERRKKKLTLSEREAWQRKTEASR